MPTISVPENDATPAPRAVSREVACHVLWHFGDVNLGLEGGTFTARLLLTISAADRVNREKLRAAYPEHVTAFLAVAQEHWGLEWLRKIAREVVFAGEEQGS